MTDNRDVEEIVLDGSEYDLIRVRHGMTALVSVSRKIELCGLVSLAGVAIVPIVLLLPRQVRAVQLDGDPLGYPLGLSVILLLGLLALFAGGLGLVYVARQSRSDQIPERRAWFLVGLEDIFSGFAFLNGGLAILTVLCLVSIGFGGAESVESFQASGVSPYLPSPVPWTTASTAGVASVFSGAVLLGASRLFVSERNR